MDPFVNFVIRPPRADYNVEDLLESEFVIKGRSYQRTDIEIRNSRGYLLQCSHYLPVHIPQDAKLPCVIYCHGNSGCRADGNEAAIVLLPSNITVFTLDFSGSGHSDGDYVSLGWNEKDDLKAVVAYLRSLKHTSCIGLWGRSMGAVTSLLYGVEDPSIAGLVLDSPFSNLYNLMMELVDVYKIRLPKFTIKVALQIMRRIIQKRARFDILDMNVIQLASKSFMPALFGHAKGDAFVPPHHSDLIHREYAGDKNIIMFDGDHNSSRPRFYYDSVTIFFHNVLHPPVLSTSDEAFNLLEFDGSALTCHQESLEHFTWNGRVFQASESQRSEGKERASHSIAKSNSKNSMQCKSSMDNSEEVADIRRKVESAIGVAEHPEMKQVLESKSKEPNGDCFSYPSSNGASTEGWGRCSSQGLSDNSAEASPTRENFTDFSANTDDKQMMLSRATSVSLQDANSANAKILSDPQGIGTRKRCKLESLSRKLKLRCFRGVPKRNNGTP